MSTNNCAGGEGCNSSTGVNEGGSSGGPCGACKFLRRKCRNGCIFAPYFHNENGATHFAAVHKVFGTSNVSKLLLSIPAHKRYDAVITISYEAQARIKDPVYGCVSRIFSLEKQVKSLRTELSYLQEQIATQELLMPLPQPTHPPPPPPLSSSSPYTSTTNHPSPILPNACFDQSMNLSLPLTSPLIVEHIKTHGNITDNFSEISNSGDLQSFAGEIVIQNPSSRQSSTDTRLCK